MKIRDIKICQYWELISHFCILQWKKPRKIWLIFDFERWLWKPELCYIWPSIPNRTKHLEHFYDCFHRPYLPTTKLCSAQLFKWGQSTLLRGLFLLSRHFLIMEFATTAEQKITLGLEFEITSRLQRNWISSMQEFSIPEICQKI